MSQYSKRWGSPAVAVLAVVAVFATASEAFAQPSESGRYTNEFVASAGPLKTQGTLAEARNGGNQLDVWRANTQSPAPVWLSINHGAPFTIGNTATLASPAVTPFGTNNFMVFHTAPTVSSTGPWS